MTPNNIYQGNCLDVLKDFPDNSIDSIVTDPPYELGFMGKSWDSTGIANNKEMWAECLRVLKPGGHLLAFSGTRTYHRMASAIEDAGFEVRDMIEWVYGSGFPKSLNIGKAVDKSDKGSAKLDFVRWMQTTGIRAKDIDDRLKSKGLISQTSNFAVHFFNEGQPALPTKEYWEVIQAICDQRKIAPPNEIEEYIDLRVYGSKQFRQREVVGSKKSGIGTAFGDGEWASGQAQDVDITAPATEAAKQWEGWGTALKPAHEPICMARKPLAEKTVAENVLKYGTGGINIDESRVDVADSEKEHFEKEWDRDQSMSAELGGVAMSKGLKATSLRNNVPSGRFPANLIHDGSDEVKECFPNESERFFKSTIYQAKASKSERNKGCEELEEKVGGGMAGTADQTLLTGSGNIRNNITKNNHPTVKPIALMEYLIKMVTPKGGIVLDPFTGSGSTLVAAKQNGFQYVGIEMTPEYIEIAQARLK